MRTCDISTIRSKCASGKALPRGNETIGYETYGRVGRSSKPHKKEKEIHPGPGDESFPKKHLGNGSQNFALNSCDLISPAIRSLVYWAVCEAGHAD